MVRCATQTSKYWQYDLGLSETLGLPKLWQLCGHIVGMMIIQRTCKSARHWNKCRIENLKILCKSNTIRSKCVMGVSPNWDQIGEYKNPTWPVRFASLRFLGSPISGSPSHRAVGFMTPCGKANRGKPNLVVFSSWKESLQKMLKQKLNYPLHCLMVKVHPWCFDGRFQVKPFIGDLPLKDMPQADLQRNARKMPYEKEPNMKKVGRFRRWLKIEIG